MKKSRLREIGRRKGQDSAENSWACVKGHAALTMRRAGDRVPLRGYFYMPKYGELP